METTNCDLKAIVEGMLFVAEAPLSLDRLCNVLEEFDRSAIREALSRLADEYAVAGRGVVLAEVADGYQLRTRPEITDYLRRLNRTRTPRFSQSALETLAIIAYRQPVTAPEISDLRGVNSTQTIRTLLERRMIRVSGRKNVVGSPFLYRTTREFLVHFGLNDIRDLPQLEEFGDLIGEHLNDELVANINAAEVTPDSIEIPLAEGEEVDDAAATEDDPQVELESSGTEAQRS
jgi:segregation and condensation protein B